MTLPTVLPIRDGLFLPFGTSEGRLESKPEPPEPEWRRGLYVVAGPVPQDAAPIEGDPTGTLLKIAHLRKAIQSRRLLDGDSGVLDAPSRRTTQRAMSEQAQARTEPLRTPAPRRTEQLKAARAYARVAARTAD